MKAGPLHNLVTFQVKTIPDPVNSFGEPVEDWADSFQVWAAYEPLGTREFPIAHKRFAETTARFRVYFDSRIYTDNAADKLRIVMVLNGVTTTWNLQDPQPVAGQLDELWIEASQIK